MKYKKWAFLLKYKPLTYLMATLGVLVYGLPVIFLLVFEGYDSSIWGIYAWGLTVMIFSLFYLLQTWRTERFYKQKHLTNGHHHGQKIS